MNKESIDKHIYIVLRQYSLQSERRKKMNQYQMANTLMHLWKILGAQYNTDIIRYRKNFPIELRFQFFLEKQLNNKIFEILRSITSINRCIHGAILYHHHITYIYRSCEVSLSWREPQWSPLVHALSIYYIFQTKLDSGR